MAARFTAFVGRSWPAALLLTWPLLGILLFDSIYMQVLLGLTELLFLLAIVPITRARLLRWQRRIILGLGGSVSAAALALIFWRSISGGLIFVAVMASYFLLRRRRLRRRAGA